MDIIRSPDPILSDLGACAQPISRPTTDLDHLFLDAHELIEFDLGVELVACESGGGDPIDRRPKARVNSMAWSQARRVSVRRGRRSGGR